MSDRRGTVFVAEGRSGESVPLALREVRHVKYALVIWHGEEYSLSPEEVDAMPEHQAWIADLRERGVYRGGERLRPTATTKVQVRRGETLVSDGPYAETKDLMGGFALVECAHLDEAIEVAAGHPFAAYGTVEVRPVWE